MIQHFILRSFICLMLSGCATEGLFKSNQRIIGLLDLNTYLLEGVSKDVTYGYSKSNPIKLGGVYDDQDVINQHRYLNALLGLNGETVSYRQLESCCYYDLPPDNPKKIGLLERYELTIPSTGYKTIIFINSYEKEKLLAPRGFSHKK